MFENLQKKPTSNPKGTKPIKTKIRTAYNIAQTDIGKLHNSSRISSKGIVHSSKGHFMNVDCLLSAEKSGWWKILECVALKAEK
jgi:hypothetical protein